MSFLDKRFCVYLHRRKDNNKIFYIGQGTLSRVNSTGRSKPWKDLVAKSNGFSSEIVMQGLTKEEALELEVFMIDFFWQDSLINKPYHNSKVSDLDYESFSARYFVDETSPTGLRYKVDVYAKRPSFGDSVILHRAGDPAGSKSQSGYSVSWNRKGYRVHRIIWLLTYGTIDPTLVIDHIDGNPLNNRISNLRLVDHKVNTRNRGIDKRNKLGFSGFSLDKKNTLRVSVNLADGTRESKSFSLNTTSYEEALEKLKIWRKEILEKDNSLELFTDRHLTNTQEHQ